ncbi:MAG: hypothetical protein J6M56_12725 [Clostridia bacterium]|nr:hypothetical protein [Clostridia bacterium]
MKGRLTNLLNRLKADITQDNMTKAGIAEQTVQHALAGIQEAVTLNPSLPEAEQETPLTEHYVLARYRGDNGKKRAGRLFVLRKKG